jgi:Tfp pilus assembly protein PilF
MGDALAAALLPAARKPEVRVRSPRAVVIGGILVALVTALAIAGRSWSRAPAQPSSVAAAGTFRSLAIRPLRDLAPSPDHAHFAPGLTDVLVSQLGAIGALRVVLLAEGEDPGNAALADLGLDAVFEGSIIRHGGRIRLSPRVVQAKTGTLLWGKPYEGDESDAYSLQADMAIDLARDLHVPVSATESRRLARRYLVSDEAQERYLRARYLLDTHTRENLMQARTEFETAVQLEGEYAPALAGLAMTYMALGNIGVLTPAEVQRLAPEPATRAFALDPTLAEAALAVADLRFRVNWDWTGAEEAYRHAVALNPSNVDARGQYARFLAAAGRTAEAMREAQDAYEIDPLSSDIHSVVGIMLFYDRRFDEAIEHFRARLGDPSARSHTGLGRAASAAGRHAEAVPALRRAVELSGQDPSIQAELARALAAAGDRNQAIVILRDLEERRARNAEYIAPQDLAYIHIALGEFDVAIDLLNQAVDEHASRLLWIGVDPRIDPVRNDPRFAEFLAKLKPHR